MKFENLKELIQKSRCTRRFKHKEISIKELEELVDLARVTSSAKNMQPLKYILVTKKEFIKQLSQTALWATHLTNWTQSKDEKPNAYIIMLNDKTIDGFAMFDAGVSFEAISLGAKAKELSVCALASINKEVCKEIFNLPEHLEVLIGIAIGEAKEKIKIVKVENNNTNYYRDEEDTHCVPKRDLEDLIIGKYK